MGWIGIEKWKGNSPWVGSGLRNGKETHRGSTFGTRRTVGGAVRNACGVRYEECAAVRELRLCCVRSGNGLK